MKKFLLSSLLTALNLSMCVCCFSQIIPRTAVMPDSTYSPSIQNGINPIPNSPNVCDYTDIRIFPSANVQAEVHISINKLNPNNLVASANTYLNILMQRFRHYCCPIL